MSASSDISEKYWSWTKPEITSLTKPFWDALQKQIGNYLPHSAKNWKDFSIEDVNFKGNVVQTKFTQERYDDLYKIKGAVSTSVFREYNEIAHLLGEMYIITK